MQNNMIQYGNYKRGSSKLHPHDKCGVCSEKTISKKAVRRRGKEELLELAAEVEAEIKTRRDFDLSAWAWELAKQVAELND